MNNKNSMKATPSTTLHVWSNGNYIGNIMYTHFLPQFSEEEFEDTILEQFPQLKGKNWNVSFSYFSLVKEEDTDVHLEGVSQPSLKTISEDVKVHLMANAKRAIIVIIVMFILSLIAFYCLFRMVVNQFF